MPDGDASKVSAFNEKLVVVNHAGLFVQFLGQQLTVAGSPVEYVGQLVVCKTRHAHQVAARRVVTDDERIRAVQRRRRYHAAEAGTPVAGTHAAVPCSGIE